MTEVCATIREQLDDALDARLEPETQAVFDAHVEACAACAAEWEFAVSLRASLLRMGTESAPAGLREAIAADVRAEMSPTTVARSAAWRPFGRAAAAAALVVAAAGIGYFAMRPSRDERPAAPQGNVVAEAPPPEVMMKPPAPGRIEAPRDGVALAKGARGAPRVAAMTPMAFVSRPGNGVPQFTGRGAARAPADARIQGALDAVREIATEGPQGRAQLSRVVTAEASPEDRALQAQFLTLLHVGDNLDFLADAAEGEDRALAVLMDDADDALAAFAGVPRLEPGQAAAPAADPQPLPHDQESAMRVVRATESRKPDAAGLRVAPPQPPGPAFFVLSGPGAITRGERVLADRGFATQTVSLRDRKGDERQRKIAAREAAYRIVEVDVPSDAWNALIGDLESLTGLRLAPVGDPGEGAPQDPAVLPPIRKLRLVLMGQ